MGKAVLRKKFVLMWLFLFLFLSINTASVYGECVSRSSDQMWSFLIDIQNYTKRGTVTNGRISAGKVIGQIYETTYLKPYESVEIKIIEYLDEEIATSDVSLFPTSTDSKEWRESTFNGYNAFERNLTIVSSEYLEYTAEIRVFNGCTVVRGFWHEKVRQYEQLVTLKDGRASLETVLGAIVGGVLGTPVVDTSPPPVTATPPVITPFPVVKPKIVVLANSIDYSLASFFFGFLEGRGYDVVRVTAGDFDLHKGEGFIVILGGPDSPEGVGERVQGLLTMAEGTSIREKGSKKIYSKSDVWRAKQKVIILAGSDRLNTVAAHEENREKIALEAELYT